MDILKNPGDTTRNRLDGRTKKIICEAYKAFLSGDFEMGEALVTYVNNCRMGRKKELIWSYTERLFEIKKHGRNSKRKGEV